MNTKITRTIVQAGLDPASLAAIQTIFQLGWGIDAYLLSSFQTHVDRAVDLGFLEIREDKVYPTKQCQQLFQTLKNIRTAH